MLNKGEDKDDGNKRLRPAEELNELLNEIESMSQNGYRRCESGAAR